MPRALQLTHRLQATICELIRMGASLEDAAGAEGVDKLTLREWQLLGKNPRNQKYYAFVQEVAFAVQGRKIFHLKRINKFAQTDPHSAQWVAERVERNFFRPPRVDSMVHIEVSNFLDRLKRRLSTEIYEQVLVAASEDDGGIEEAPQLQASNENEGTPK